MLPDRKEAEKILKEAEKCNPGMWGDHSRVAGMCAGRIAAASGLNKDKACILGLLHDIGRRFGKGHLQHVYDGYKYMMDMGYDEVAKICLTHSFTIQNISCYIGNIDIRPEQYQELADLLTGQIYDDYDRLIQLCDSIAMAEGVVDIEVRMGDVKRRYGSYPQEKWNKNLEIKNYFENKMGRSIYDVTGRKRFI